MHKILTLNNISVAGLERLPRDDYEVASEIQHPDAILLRSHNMHEMEIGATVKAVGRAGAGVNNIPVEAMSGRGIAVFNAPGANANAVKELVLAGMLLACRNICQAWAFTRAIEGDDTVLQQQVEVGKKQFAGFELPGRTLGVVGLGAIGVQVANMAADLGMRVMGYDPGITVQGAWKLSSRVEQAISVDDLLARADFVSFHVPLIPATKGMINAERLQRMKDKAVILNFARQGIVEDQAVLDAMASGKIYAYVCDFPTRQLRSHERVITLPHLGASTREAEENCAVMVADQIRDYLENGNVRNSVNFPEVAMPPVQGCCRLAVVNRNVPNMVGQISTDLAQAGLNITDMINKSKGDIAYSLLDLQAEVDEPILQQIAGIDGVLSVRRL